MRPATGRLLAATFLLLPLVASAVLTGAEARPDIGVDQTAVMGEPAGTPLAGAALDELTETVASKMRCPTCQGLSVADSRTLSSLAMKGEIRDFLAAGYSEEQVLEYFERSYGEFIRLEPKPEGFNLVAWWLPGLFVLVGGVLVAMRLRAGRGGGAAADRDVEPQSDPELEAYRQRIRRELGS